MALSAAVKYTNRPGLVEDIQVVDAEVIYGEALVGVYAADFATTASRGRLHAYLATASMIPLGFAAHVDAITGSTSASPIHTAGVNFDRGDKLLPITGLAGTYADIGLEVWASDDGTFTTTRSTDYTYVGIVVGYYSSSYAWVHCLAPMDQVLMTKAGQGRKAELIGIVSAIAASAGAGATINMPTLKVPHHTRLLEIYGVGLVAAAGGAASGGATQCVVTVEIGASGAATSGTAVSGGTITITSDGFSPGTRTAGGTLSGNTRHIREGQNIILEMNPSVTGTAGQVMVYGVFDQPLGF